MLQIVLFLVSLESSQLGGVHENQEGFVSFGSMMFGLLVQKLLNIK